MDTVSPATFGNMRTDGVRIFAVYCGLTALLLLVTLLPARSYEMPYDPYPWCAEYWDGPGTDCGFLTIEQCRASVSGVGGSCQPNPFYNPRRSQSQGHRRKPR